jgi:hypothetical protein
MDEGRISAGFAGRPVCSLVGLAMEVVDSLARPVARLAQAIPDPIPGVADVVLELMAIDLANCSLRIRLEISESVLDVHLG